MGSTQEKEELVFKTRILPVKTADLGQFTNRETLKTWELPKDEGSLGPLKEAAKLLRETSIPVGFPTETVYGLGADATRSDAVKGIYKAKGRPSDNPLIIHVCDLTMLRNLLLPAGESSPTSASEDLIPAIYKPLIERFWPGPLTILLPNPQPSKLAPEVTAALSLIHLAGVPLAAPSANASTKPSPTTAEHVRYDLDGKINVILDGGPCQVGVESTVVDGMCNPPVVLRPGGVSIDEIRKCHGWANVTKGYKDSSELGSAAPRAPGMKYKHYSPKAKVVLYEARSGHPGSPLETWRLLGAKEQQISYHGLETLSWPVKIGIVSTKYWESWAGFEGVTVGKTEGVLDGPDNLTTVEGVRQLPTQHSFTMCEGKLWKHSRGNLKYYQEHPTAGNSDDCIADLIQISLGKETKDIAHGLFSALRELDQRGADIIYVEGIPDEGDIAAAVMNRLRKAASVIEKKEYTG
jgi:L-threonylcarbamoyladenylate synthase